MAKWRRYKYLSEQDQKRLTVALRRVRMACDSTYLVDHKTREHNKPQELMALLENTLAEDDQVKVVVFSQWLRMRELAVEALETGPWGFACFHGGVDVRVRRNLVRQFHTDPQTRLFLATDAEETGPVLQAGSGGQPGPPLVPGGARAACRPCPPPRAAPPGADRESRLGGHSRARFMETIQAVAEAVPATSRETDGGDEGDAAVLGGRVRARESATDRRPAAGTCEVSGYCRRSAARPLGRGRPAPGMGPDDQAADRNATALRTGGLRARQDPGTGQTVLEAPLPADDRLAELLQAAHRLLDLLLPKASPGGVRHRADA